MMERILQLFDENPDAFVSGEMLSRHLECSRTAVWKHIQSLRAKGYEFEAVSRRGYRLTRKPERLDIVSLLSRLATKTMGRNIKHFDSLPSTQTLAHQLAREGAPEGTVVLAEEQTAGRGRMGRAWYSPSGKSISMSIVLRPRLPMHFIPQLTLLAAVALHRAIRKMIDVQVDIKWPNDLLIGGKKISGILLESNAEDERLVHVIAGIGISANIAAEDYSDELREKATSLMIESGKRIDREALICAFFQEFEVLYELCHEQGFAPIRTLWEASCVTLGRNVKVDTAGGLVEGVATGLDDHGALIVRNADGQYVHIYSGDVQFQIRNS